MTTPSHAAECIARHIIEREWRSEFVERFRALLRTKQMTVNMLSKATEQLYGATSPFFVPHNFCYNVVAKRTSLHICQVLALSKLTGYDFSECLAFFGFPADNITRFQLLLHSERTVLLPSVVYDKNRLIPFMGSIVNPEDLDHTGSLASKAHQDAGYPAAKIEECNRHNFLYARIGQKDALAFPDVFPGSIVRVDQRRVNLQPGVRGQGQSAQSRPIYLVEYPGGLVCCHVDALNRDDILLTASALPFASPEYRLNEQVRILGTVDAEIRPLSGISLPDFTSFHRVDRPSNQQAMTRHHSLCGLLRARRERNSITIRRAHQMTLEVAEQLANSEYMISTGSFFEFEAANTLPRHIEKVFSLCIAYNIDLWTLLRAAGLPLEESGHSPIPLPSLADKRSNQSLTITGSNLPGQSLCSYLVDALEEIPLFLLDGFSGLAPGLDAPSRGLFWVGRQEIAYHPWTEGAVLVVVDAGSKGRSKDSKWLELWERPIYVLMLRDDRYVIGFCSFVEDRMTLIPHPACKVPPLHFLAGRDAEVIGRVTAIARRIPH
jgi:hypothetical protein